MSQSVTNIILCLLLVKLIHKHKIYAKKIKHFKICCKAVF